MSPRDVCALLASTTALRHVRSLLGKRLALHEHSSILRLAVALLRRFYQREFSHCTEAATADLDEHRLVKVPEAVYELLKTIGFCTFRGPQGKQLLFDEKGIPVCVGGENRAWLRGKVLAPQVWGLTDAEKAAQAEKQQQMVLKNARLQKERAEAARVAREKKDEDAQRKEQAINEQHKAAEARYLKAQMNTKEAQLQADEDMQKKLSNQQTLNDKKRKEAALSKATQVRDPYAKPLTSEEIQDRQNRILQYHQNPANTTLMSRFGLGRRAQIELLHSKNEAIAKKQAQLTTNIAATHEHIQNLKDDKNFHDIGRNCEAEKTTCTQSCVSLIHI